MSSGINAIGNLLGKVNASNALVVTLDGGTASATKFLAGDGTAAAPSYSFTSAATTGWYLASAVPSLSIGGQIRYQWDSTTFYNLSNTSQMAWGASSDLITAREAADHWFHRRSTNAQRLSVANTYTSATNYSAFSVDMQTTPGTATVGTRTAAAGTGIPLKLVAQASSAGTFGSLQLETTGVAVLSGRFSAGGLTSAGTVGVPVVAAYGDVAAATNTGTASIATVTPAVDTTYEVSANCLVTTSTNHSFSLDVTYTDESNVARTMVLPVAALAGAFLTAGLITNVTGAGPYETPAMTIRAKASTAVTVRTSAGGTFTTVVYNARGVIKQVS